MWNMRKIYFDTNGLHVISMTVNDPAYADET